MKLTKVLCMIFVVLTLLFTTTGCKSSYRSLDDILEDGKLVVATNAEFAPFEYLEGTEFKGIDMELIAAYADYIGVELVIKDQDFDAALIATSTNKADLTIAAITKNETREKTLSFSDSYYFASQVIIVAKDSEYASLTTVDEVLALLSANKAKIGVQRGTTGEYYVEGDADWGFDGIADTVLQTYDNGALATFALSNGQIDAVIIDLLPAEMFIESYSNLTVLDMTFTEEEYAIACDKGNESLIASFNAFLTEAKADGTLDEIVSHYYAE